MRKGVLGRNLEVIEDDQGWLVITVKGTRGPEVSPFSVSFNPEELKRLRGFLNAPYLDMLVQQEKDFEVEAE